MQKTYYELSRLTRIHRLRQAALRMLKQYDIEFSKLSFISSSFPNCRISGLPQQYLLKFSRGLYPEAGENIPNFHPPGTSTHLQLLWMEALARDTDLVLQKPIRNTAGELISSAEVHGLPEPVDGFLCTWVPGRILSRTWRPKPWPSPKSIRQMSRVAAILHTHAQGWTLPPGLQAA